MKPISLWHWLLLTFVVAAALTAAEGAVRQGFIALGLLACVVFLPRFLKRRKDARTTIDVAELKQRIDAGERLRLLDVRDASDFDGSGGHIPGAMNIPLPQLKARVNELRSGDAIAVYCRTDRRSTQAVEYLRAAGYANALVVSGGMVEWGNRGLPVEVATVLHQ